MMDVKMQSEVLSTDEVLIIGYGTIKKEDATGSIQAVSSEMFNKGAITSPQDLLAGKVAGRRFKYPNTAKNHNRSVVLISKSPFKSAWHSFGGGFRQLPSSNIASGLKLGSSG